MLLPFCSIHGISTNVSWFSISFLYVIPVCHPTIPPLRLPLILTFYHYKHYVLHKPIILGLYPSSDRYVIINTVAQARNKLEFARGAQPLYIIHIFMWALPPRPPLATGLQWPPPNDSLNQIMLNFHITLHTSHYFTTS